MIHQYENNGYQIILDVNSGAVHVVDPLCYELMEWLTGILYREGTGGAGTGVGSSCGAEREVSGE